MPTAADSGSTLVEEAKRQGLMPKVRPGGKGYVGVSIVKEKYYAGRFWDKKAKKQRHVPGLHATELDAALALARAKQIVDSMEEGETIPSPAKRKSRRPPPPGPIMPIAFAIPLEAASPRMPLANVQPMACVVPVAMTAPVTAASNAAAYTPPAASEVANLM